METVTETWEQRQERERAEQAVKIEGANKKGREVLKALGFTYKKPEENFHEARVIGVKGDSEICITSGGYSVGFERFKVSGRYPRDSRGGYIGRVCGDDYQEVGQPSISVSSGKTADQIAKDIRRRFLPDHEKYLALVQKRVKSENDYQATIAAALKLITGQVDKNKASTEHSASVEPGGEGFGTVTAHGDSVHLELRSITPEQAKAALEASRKVADKRSS